jgi:SOS-response transcriptional repressor LexA
METFAERLIESLKKQKVTQSELARLLGIKPQSVQALCSGRAKTTAYLSDISQILNVSPIWLRSGKGPRSLAGSDRVYLATGRIPLVRWDQIEHLDLVAIAGDEETTWINTPKPLGADSFALKIVGNSMMNPAGDSFPPGHIIAVDPKWPLKNDCYVIANMENQKPVLRHYTEEEGRQYLRLLNPGYPNPVSDVTGHMKLYGVVRGLYKDFD